MGRSNSSPARACTRHLPTSPSPPTCQRPRPYRLRVLPAWLWWLLQFRLRCPFPSSVQPSHTDSPALVPTPVVKFSSPSLPADTFFLLALVALVLSHGFAVLAGNGMYRTAQWQPSYVLALKTRQQRSMVQDRSLSMPRRLSLSQSPKADARLRSSLHVSKRSAYGEPFKPNRDSTNVGTEVKEIAGSTAAALHQTQEPVHRLRQN